MMWYLHGRFTWVLLTCVKSVPNADIVMEITHLNCWDCMLTVAALSNSKSHHTSSLLTELEKYSNELGNSTGMGCIIMINVRNKSCQIIVALLLWSSRNPLRLTKDKSGRNLVWNYYKFSKTPGFNSYNLIIRKSWQGISGIKTSLNH